MLALPVPIFVSLILGFLVAHALLRGKYHPLLITLISLCALQSLIIALHQFYGVQSLRLIQPVTAALIPPLAWLAFITMTRESSIGRENILHLLGPAFCAFCAAFVPVALDITVPASFFIYGAMMLYSTLKDGGELPRVRLESGNIPRHLWQVIAISLLASAGSDVLIVIAQIFQLNNWQPIIITVFSSLTLLALGALSLSRELDTTESRTSSRTDTSQHLADDIQPAQVAAADTEIMHRLNELLKDQRLYLDPDLTLARLARKASVPAKTLSATINRSCGENVSRHINRYRIEHACSLLLLGKPVTSTLFESGFNTKSNFNREFLRVMKAPPSEWLAATTATIKPE